MPKPIIILPISHPYFSRMVVWTSWFEGPLTTDGLARIEATLVRKDVPAQTLLLDLLLKVGNTSNRFIQVDFDGKTIDRSSFEIVRIPRREGNVRRATTEFLMQQNLEPTILNTTQKRLIKKGVEI